MNPKIPLANILALKTIVEKFNGKSINWVLIGSTALAIHGVDVEVHDIDIMTDMENADKIAGVLKEFTVEPMHLKTSSQFKSYYGMFKINNVQVEVIADLERIYNDEWIKVEKSRIKEIKRYEGMMLPLLELKEEYEAYKNMGRMEKANKILEFIKKEEEWEHRNREHLKSGEFMDEEYVDIVDSKGKLTGQSILKRNAHKNGTWHLGAHIWIYNSKGEILLQKRSITKNNYPGLLDISSAGHVSSGEKPEEAAIRELDEELGIKIKSGDLKHIRILRAPDVRKGWRDREFDYVFLLKWNGNISKLKFLDGEVEYVEWISLDKLESEVGHKVTSKKYVPHGKYYNYIIKVIRNELNKTKTKVKR